MSKMNSTTIDRPIDDTDYDYKSPDEIIKEFHKTHQQVDFFKNSQKNFEPLNSRQERLEDYKIISRNNPAYERPY